ncbi:MAG TPA: hypothetical protein VIT64_12350 [Ilumatobacteraceae bacterium]
MTDPSPSPLGRLVDLALFVPIGVVCKLRDEVPQFAEAGRARVEGQIRLARVIGQLAVKQGRREVVRRLDEVAEQRRGASAPLVVEALLREEPAVESPVVTRPAVEQAVVERPAVKKAAVKKAAVKKAAVEKPAGRATPDTAPAAAPIDAASLPISDYDSLAASQVVARLEALGPDDLTAIGSYEAATRGRRTILGKVHQLQAG